MTDGTKAADPAKAEYEYIVVGSGAGGGTVAARLAEAGARVLVLEAGGDPKRLQGGNPLFPQAERLAQDYEVPAFHALSTENHALRWDFWVRHYGDTAKQKRDPKYRETFNGETVDGVYYPRAGALGGCTAHNAMILLYPHNKDWEDIAALTGDKSWKADAMRGYFERMEDCRHRLWPPWRWIGKLLGWNPTRHGFNGWLRTEKAFPRRALWDFVLVHTLARAVKYALKKNDDPVNRFTWAFEGKGDPNDWRLVEEDAIGIRYPPLTTRGHARMGTRERLLEVQHRHPDRLTIELDALVTRVLIDDDNRAIGVAYQKGKRLYEAHWRPSGHDGEARQVFASREVILAGGAFNTPQLLMLSGIGDRAALEAHGIAVRADLPGVGKNLQDRYEVTQVNRMKSDWGHSAAWNCARVTASTGNGRTAAAPIPPTARRLPWCAGPPLPVPCLICSVSPCSAASWAISRAIRAIPSAPIISPGPCSRRTRTTPAARSNSTLTIPRTRASGRRSTSDTSRREPMPAARIWLPWSRASSSCTRQQAPSGI
ncbi:GMC family oxidoreductase [Breoghania sp. L-A4]|uniref:GMC family oxidoreductase n=1 Tax=Breoghania sp. L-A4 TaxID=2304600 RepID=UPI0020C17A18|nr:GMC family oxidoreductase [Breoghania sp. L-A4]